MQAEPERDGTWPPLLLGRPDSPRRFSAGGNRPSSPEGACACTQRRDSPLTECRPIAGIAIRRAVSLMDESTPQSGTSAHDAANSFRASPSLPASRWTVPLASERVAKDVSQIGEHAQTSLLPDSRLRAPAGTPQAFGHHCNAPDAQLGPLAATVGPGCPYRPSWDSVDDAGWPGGCAPREGNTARERCANVRRTTPPRRRKTPLHSPLLSRSGHPGVIFDGVNSSFRH